MTKRTKGTYTIIDNSTLGCLLQVADAKTGVLLYLAMKANYKNAGTGMGELMDVLAPRNRRTIERAVKALMQAQLIQEEEGLFYISTNQPCQLPEARTYMHADMRAFLRAKPRAEMRANVRAFLPKSPSENSVQNADLHALKEEKEEKELKNPPLSPPPSAKPVNPEPEPPIVERGRGLVERVQKMASTPQGEMILRALPNEIHRRDRLEVLELVALAYPQEIIRDALAEMRPRLPQIINRAVYLRSVCERLAAERTCYVRDPELARQIEVISKISPPPALEKKTPEQEEAEFEEFMRYEDEWRRQVEQMHAQKAGRHVS